MTTYKTNNHINSKKLYNKPHHKLRKTKIQTNFLITSSHKQSIKHNILNKLIKIYLFQFISTTP